MKSIEDIYFYFIESVESVEITPMTLTFQRRTADVTYCADVTLFLHATSGRLPLMIETMIVCLPTFCVLIVKMVFGPIFWV